MSDQASRAAGGDLLVLERLEALETKAAYQERAVVELSSELFEASRRIERLEKLLRGMAGKIKELTEAAEPQASGDVRPPHW
ncbi:MAG TPA: SlyX family protein [Rectinemataceae bacterium]|nr:SlyX family protein [Rectinemataceae bacterium]